MKNIHKDELTITKERVLSAAEKCESAKEILKEIFPEVFKEEYCCEYMTAARNCCAIYIVGSDKWVTTISSTALQEAEYEFFYCPFCGKKLNT